MTVWVPKSSLESAILTAARHAGAAPASFDEAIDKLVNAYYGYRTAYDQAVGERAGLLGRISTLECERDGYKNAYEEERTSRHAFATRAASLESERDGYKNAYEEEIGQRGESASAISSLRSERDGYKNAYEEEVSQRAERYAKMATLESERDGYAGAYRTMRMERDRARLALKSADAGGERGPHEPRRPRGAVVPPPAACQTVGPTSESSMEPQNEPDRLVAAAREAEAAGDREGAITSLIGAQRLMHGYGPAVAQANRIGNELFAEAIVERDRGEHARAQALLVRSLELNPGSDEARDALQALLDLDPGRDLTQECLIFPDAARATRFYRGAIQTCLDFVAFGGVGGEILEFGVLAGWTARHFAELSRDMGFYPDLYLFDSFEGLPRSKAAIDAASYDVARGLWREEMQLPKSWEEEIGSSIDVHVGRMLSQVLSPSRIHIRKGFFSETLKAPLACKAAIVHLDCDLYQSTVEVFAALERDDVLQDGTILMFDDWNCNRANPAFGQRRAFAEFLARHAGRWSASHYLNYGFNCAAFILHDGRQGEGLGKMER